MGSEQGSCDPHLIKTNWFDKRHKLNVYKEICVLISNSNISHFKMVTVQFNDDMCMFQLDMGRYRHFMSRLTYPIIISQ